MESRVTIEIQNHIAFIKLNRPLKRNALDLQMFESIIEAGIQIQSTPEVRVVILYGEGQAFCAGLDFSMFVTPGLTEKLVERTPDSIANIVQRVGYIWREIEVPVLVSLHGAALGGGLQIALGGDIRIAHPQTKFAIREIEYGLIPDMGITCTLRGLVRADIARELTMTGRIFDGQEAERYGFVTRLSENPFEATRALAQEMLTRSPDALKAAKRLWNESQELSLKEAMLLETELQLPLIGKPNQTEAVMASLEKRVAQFT